MRFLKDKALLFIVFVTGAAVLVVEVTATRILAPYFGNTIYSVSSVISTILAALSFGYYFGGYLSDRYPSLSLFYGIIVLGGIFVFILEILNLLLLPILGHAFSLVTGPLVSSILLFFASSFFLGMLSPYAIKLIAFANSRKGIGQIAGEVFFWSTLGSIFGGIFSGFYLIPHFGVGQIIISCGWILSIIGIFGIIKEKKILKRKLFILIIVTITFGAISTSLLFSVNQSSSVLYSKDGVYEKILIYDAMYHGQPARFLMQDRNYSAAEYLNSNESAFDYTKYYELYKIFNSNTKRALVLGAGAYSVPKLFLLSQPEGNVDAVDVEPGLYDLAKKYFNIKDDSRINSYVEDGRRFLYNSTNSYDLIFGDVYQAFAAVPSHFTTYEFFRLVKSKLADQGIFVMNFMGSLATEHPSLTFSEIKTFRSVFQNNYIFAVTNSSTPNAQNLIFVGWNTDRKLDMAALKANKSNFIATLGDHLVTIDPNLLDSYPELTDNYAPVEYLSSKLVYHLKP